LVYLLDSDNRVIIADDRSRGPKKNQGPIRWRLSGGGGPAEED